MSKKIIGVYETNNEAMKTIRSLIAEGYDPKEISILAKDERQMDEIADQTHVAEEHPLNGVNEEAYGTIAGFLTGISGLIAVPGLTAPVIGPLIAAGPFAKLFKENEDHDLKEMLLTLNISERQAEQYVDDLHHGCILVILEKDNAKD
ncbi:general stress protein [Fictibacillus sp. Mic-4]|uniref:general stress protein n=1 Tax=Fictibacillus TaxID=1329200 RepID=UPI000426098E|nr:general stress protein [Fictibacillus gelatini]